MSSRWMEPRQRKCTGQLQSSSSHNEHWGWGWLAESLLVSGSAAGGWGKSVSMWREPLISRAILYWSRCLACNQWSDCTSNFASTRPSRRHDSGEVILRPLELVRRRWWFAMQNGVAVVKSGSDYTASHCVTTLSVSRCRTWRRA